MGEALLTRRGSGGGTIKNGIAKSVFPVEDIRQNMFVEQVPAVSLFQGSVYYSNVVSYDGENFLCSSGASLYFLTKNEQGVYEQSDAINIGVTTNIGEIYFLSNQIAIITTLVATAEKPAYWYIFEIDFSSKTVTKKYTSAAFAGQWANYNTTRVVRFQAISQNRFLLMFLTENLSDYSGNQNYRFSLYSIDSSWKLKEEKTFFASGGTDTTGYLKSYSLGKFDDGEDENGKYGLYWAQIDYYEEQYTATLEKLRRCFRLSIKIYYDTGEYEELYKVTSKGTSIPPGLYGAPIVIKNTIVSLGQGSINIIKFGTDHIPVSASPTSLALTQGDIESGYGSKYPIAYKMDSLTYDEVYFIYIQTVNKVNYYAIGKIVPTEDLVTYEFLYLIGNSGNLPSEITDNFLCRTDWTMYGTQNCVVNKSSPHGVKYLALDYPMVKQAENLIFGVSGIKELKKNEVGTVYSI